MADEVKELTGAQMIDMLAPLVGIDPGLVRSISVSARFNELAFFNIEMITRVNVNFVFIPGKVFVADGQ